jgi:hypothetical protein
MTEKRSVRLRILVTYAFDGEVLKPGAAHLLQDGYRGQDEERRLRSFWPHVEAVSVVLPIKRPSVTAARRVK